MSVQQVRILIGDLPKWDRQTATGDGVTKNFIASSLPIITGSESITVNSVLQTLTTHYTLNSDLGLFIFVTAPTDGHAIVSQFQYAELSDETITAILALHSNVYLAAAMCAESLAGKYSSAVDKQVGDFRLSYSQRAKAWIDLAGKLRASASRNSMFAPYCGGISIADKQASADDTDRVQPAFTASLHNNPETGTDVLQ